MMIILISANNNEKIFIQMCTIFRYQESREINGLFQYLNPNQLNHQSVYSEQFKLLERFNYQDQWCNDDYLEQ